MPLNYRIKSCRMTSVIRMYLTSTNTNSLNIQKHLMFFQVRRLRRLNFTKFNMFWFY